MKKQLLLILFITINFFSFNMIAQSQGPNDPAAAFDPSAACLACAGSSWVNGDSVYASDGNLANVSLRELGFCFQSTCSFSRFLFVEKFGFTVPSGATINGVEANVERKASAYGVIKDSVIQLVVANTIAGNNKSTGSIWPITKTYATYGGAADIWGATLTDVDVNDTAFGVGIIVANTDTATRTAYIDHVRMKVYYTPVGISTNANDINFNAYYNTAGHTLNLKYALTTKSISAEVYNMVGQLMVSYKLQNGNSGECMEAIPVAGFSKGVYFVKVNGLPYDVVKKVIIQ